MECFFTHLKNIDTFYSTLNSLIIIKSKRIIYDESHQKYPKIWILKTFIPTISSFYEDRILKSVSTYRDLFFLMFCIPLNKNEVKSMMSPSLKTTKNSDLDNCLKIVFVQFGHKVQIFKKIIVNCWKIAALCDICVFCGLNAATWLCLICSLLRNKERKRGWKKD